MNRGSKMNLKSALEAMENGQIVMSCKQEFYRLSKEGEIERVIYNLDEGNLFVSHSNWSINNQEINGEWKAVSIPFIRSTNLGVM